MHDQAVVHITIEGENQHPAVFWGGGELSYQGDCPAASADEMHQTCIELGDSECPICGTRFSATLVRAHSRPSELLVRF